jgi:hypothetical protein
MCGTSSPLLHTSSQRSAYAQRPFTVTIFGGLFPYQRLRKESRLTQWIRFPAGTAAGFFLITTASRPFLGPFQPPAQCVPGALTPEIERPGLESDHSHISSAKVKNAWSYISTPQCVFMAWCLGTGAELLYRSGSGSA